LTNPKIPNKIILKVVKLIKVNIIGPITKMKKNINVLLADIEIVVGNLVMVKDIATHSISKIRIRWVNIIIMNTLKIVKDYLFIMIMVLWIYKDSPKHKMHIGTLDNKIKARPQETVISLHLIITEVIMM